MVSEKRKVIQKKEKNKNGDVVGDVQTSKSLNYQERGSVTLDLEKHR